MARRKKRKVPGLVSRLIAALITLSLPFLFACSPSPDVLRMVENGDRSAVYAEKYPSESRFLTEPSDFDSEIARQRSRIEEIPTLMNSLTVELYPDEKDGAGAVMFKYRGASLGEESDDLVLWYMGQLREPKVNAGYRAQWVFDTEKKYLARVYLSIVPLE
jgi:hypothetical protein